MSIDLSQLLTVAQTAKRSPLSESAIWARINRGEIPVVRVASHVYLREEELVTALGDLYRPR